MPGGDATIHPSIAGAGQLLAYQMHLFGRKNLRYLQ
jgi:hypothetical protein